MFFATADGSLPTCHCFKSTRSTYHKHGFSGNFSDSSQSFLQDHATDYTVSRFLAIICSLDWDTHSINAVDEYPLGWCNEEHWEDVFNLWLLADFLCADEVMLFVEEYIGDKGPVPGEGHKPLSPEKFRNYWNKLPSRNHHGLRQAMVIALISSPELQDNENSRDGLLDQIPVSAWKAILHRVTQIVVKTSDAIEEAELEIVDGRKSEQVWTRSDGFTDLRATFNI